MLLTWPYRCEKWPLLESHRDCCFLLVYYTSSPGTLFRRVLDVEPHSIFLLCFTFERSHLLCAQRGVCSSFSMFPTRPLECGRWPRLEYPLGRRTAASCGRYTSIPRPSSRRSSNTVTKQSFSGILFKFNENSSLLLIVFPEGNLFAVWLLVVAVAVYLWDLRLRIIPVANTPNLLTLAGFLTDSSELCFPSDGGSGRGCYYFGWSSLSFLLPMWDLPITVRFLHLVSFLVFLIPFLAKKKKHEFKSLLKLFLNIIYYKMYNLYLTYKFKNLRNIWVQ